MRNAIVIISYTSGQDKSEFSGVSKGQKWKTGSKTMAKPNSAFVSKIVTNEHLAKILAIKQSETFYLFFNTGKAIVWTDYLWRLQVCSLLILILIESIICFIYERCIRYLS